MSVWIVDDDSSIRWVLQKILEKHGVGTRGFSCAQEALNAFEEEIPQVVVTDLKMPGMSGYEFLQEIKGRFPSLPVILMTAYGDLEAAVEAFQKGAFDYLPKPFDLEKAVELIRRALLPSTAPEFPEEAESASEILGKAPAMQEVFRAIGRLSSSSATVLITGETGTGKELVARALHRTSPRKNKPFVALNTAAIPKELLESELFGHEKGAFTGAQVMRRGRFEEANGGTLFLDEIGDMPVELQTRLLRVLADGKFYRIGGQAAVQVDVRIIAATHQNLEARVNEGSFREDLFHRLNVIRLHLSPLRERVEDIPLLTRHFLKKSAQDLKLPPKELSPGAMTVIQSRPWRGNVRELENFCLWLTVMAPAPLVTPADLPREWTNEPVAEENGWQEPLARQVEMAIEAGKEGLLEVFVSEAERIVMEKVLSFAGNNPDLAARILGVGKNTLAKKQQALGLDNHCPEVSLR